MNEVSQPASAPSPVSPEPLRRFVELAYRQAWGPQGTDATKDAFRAGFAVIKAQTGPFAFAGNAFDWSGKPIPSGTPAAVRRQVMAFGERGNQWIEEVDIYEFAEQAKA